MNGALNNPAFILDCTLRDGSYLWNGFGELETYSIAKALDESGIPFIEVGHGMGLGAYRLPIGNPDCEDEDHMKATSEAVTANKWGMFFQPGIGNMEDISLAKKYGMKFIRIGVDAHDWDKSLLFIDKAKALDMYVCVNLMKTYMATPGDVAEISDEVYKRGADCLYIVDSAGTMIPNEVEEYVSAIKLTNSIAVGFHGHNNLQMAAVNTMAAFWSGAEMLDTSLRGIGRSAGNAMTEAFLIMMQRMDIFKEINLHQLLDAAEKHIDPILERHLFTTNESLLCGKAKIHSSDMAMIERYAEEWGVNKYTFAENVGNMANAMLATKIDKEMLKNVHTLMLTCK